MVWLKFIACLLIILFAGKRVARYGDVIAEKTGLGGVWVGVVLLAAATSLPELFNGISSAALVGAPDLTIGDLFGTNTFNLLVLALLDIAYRGGPLLTAAASGHMLTAGLSLVLVSFATASLLLGGAFSALGIGWESGTSWIGIYTPIIFLLYLAMAKAIFSFEKRQRAEGSRGTGIASAYEPITLRKAYLYYAIAALVIIGAGTWLAFIGREIAESTGWGQSFVGSLFLAATTSLPEIAVSFAALRLGAVDIQTMPLLP